MNFENFRKSVEVVKQANKSVTYLETSYHNTIKSSRRPTILKKTIWTSEPKNAHMSQVTAKMGLHAHRTFASRSHTLQIML